MPTLQGSRRHRFPWCPTSRGGSRSSSCSLTDNYASEDRHNGSGLRRPLERNWTILSENVHKEIPLKDCMWLREFSSCSCLTALPGPCLAWVLLSKTYKPFCSPLYIRILGTNHSFLHRPKVRLTCSPLPWALTSAHTVPWLCSQSWTWHLPPSLYQYTWLLVQ